jgi:PqqD family protein of HPr-rel-A system
VTAAIKPKIRDDLAAAELDGEAVVYDERTGELHHLNPTATIIFSLCDGSSTVREMSGEIAGAFGMPADEVERQVRALLRQFRKAGLLNGTPSTKAGARD